MKKIAFIGPLSNDNVRSHLTLKSYVLRNFCMKLIRHSLFGFPDMGGWVSEYIKSFEYNCTTNEYHIITVHPGMKVKQESFVIDNIYYHVINSNNNLLFDFINYKLHIDEKMDFVRFRKSICKTVKKINPDILVVCGAENPQYSWASIDLNSYPTFVMLQTLLNGEKRMKLNVGNPYRRYCERKIIESSQNIGVSDDESYEYVSLHNPHANVFKVTFPTRKPPLWDIEKKIDFVIYANSITKYKGIEDALRALSIVNRRGENCRMRVVGSIDTSYFTDLQNMVSQLGLIENLEFVGFCDDINDVYKYVQESKNILLPSLTAPFNSTVKEGMFMCIPIIMYETSVSRSINSDKERLITAEMGNIEDLADKMLFAIKNTDLCQEMAKNGAEYANINFSGESAGKLLIKIIDNILDDNQDISIRSALLYKKSNE